MSSGDHVVRRWRCDTALDRQAIVGKILTDFEVFGFQPCQELIKPFGACAWNIVKHHQGPIEVQAMRLGALKPTHGIIPIPRNRIPKHTGIAAPCQHFISGFIKKVRPQFAAAAKRPEQFVIMNRRAQAELCPDDLGPRPIGRVQEAQRRAMSVGVIAKPVTGVGGALGAGLGVRSGAEFLADQKEGRENAVAFQDVEDYWRGVRVGAVIKSKGNASHSADGNVLRRAHNTVFFKKPWVIRLACEANPMVDRTRSAKYPDGLAWPLVPGPRIFWNPSGPWRRNQPRPFGR